MISVVIMIEIYLKVLTYLYSLGKGHYVTDRATSF